LLPVTSTANSCVSPFSSSTLAGVITTEFTTFCVGSSGSSGSLGSLGFSGSSVFPLIVTVATTFLLGSAFDVAVTVIVAAVSSDPTTSVPSLYTFVLALLLPAIVYVTSFSLSVRPSPNTLTLNS
jgi:hypothetical protein